MKKKIGESIAVLGSQSIGEILSAVLYEQKQEIVLISNPKKNEILGGSGLTVKFAGKERIFYYPNTQNYLPAIPKAIIIAAKSVELISILSNLNPKTLSGVPIICFISGISNYETIKNLYGKNVSFASSEIYQSSQDSNLIQILNENPSITIANNLPSERDKLIPLIEILKQGKIDVKVEKSVDILLFKELTFQSSISALSALSGLTASEFLKIPEYCKGLDLYLKECADIAEKSNIELNIEEITDKIRHLPSLYSPALKEDLSRGKNGELKSLIIDLLTAADNVKAKAEFIRNIYLMLKKRLDISVLPKNKKYEELLIAPAPNIEAKSKPEPKIEAKIEALKPKETPSPVLENSTEKWNFYNQIT